jgi:hypothetical protein
MMLSAAKTIVCLSCIILSACPFTHAQCPVNSIMIKGRVEHAPRNASVRVLLLYPPDPHRKHPPGTDMEKNDQPGESAEAILDGDAFAIPVEFLTNDRRTVTPFNSACNRKPRTIVVTLKQDNGSGGSDQEQDRVSLDFPRDFKSDDSQHYTLRSDLVLNGQQP